MAQNKSVQEECEDLEQAIAQAHPGALDVLKVYGAYAEGIAEVERYLASTDDEPVYTTLSGSGGC